MKLQRLLMDSARRRPGAVAVYDGQGPTTYRQLDRLADRCAAALLARGVRAGDRVVVWTGKSTATVAVMQAALRIGAIYVPLAGSNPVARLSRVVDNARPALVVADDDTARLAVGAGWSGAPLVGQAQLLAAGPPDGLGQADLSGPDDPDRPAYILYTSGSTGEPKGVCISHRNALAFVEWAAAEVGVGPGDRLSNHAPFNFDLSVFDLYAAFLTGAAVDLISQELAYAPQQLVQFLHERRISVWYSVPSALSLMIREGGLLDVPAPPALRACVFAGEPFAIHHVHALHKNWPGVRLLNWYGPTETNVCTSYEVGDADLERDRPLPIGRACSGAAVSLDPPDTEEGEVVVSGPTVMLGYWGREPHRGPYRTGDVARRTESGVLDYVGRRDRMVKVRGHRVEPGEIETAVATLDSVGEAAVLAVGSGLDTRLHAVVVPSGARRPSLLDVKRRCAQRLPTYMIIDSLHVLDELPRTANGKTDRAKLAAAIEGGSL